MTNSSIEIQIADQYQQVVGAYIKMFEALSPRTALLNNLWRSDGGIRSCGWDRELVIRSYQGPAEGYLIKLADQRNIDRPHSITASPCIYHSKVGCIQDDLRPPSCLRIITDRVELEVRFNIYGDLLHDWIGETLEQVISGKADDKFVKEKIYQINQLTTYISTFPLLSNDEQMEDRLEKRLADRRRKATTSPVI